MRTSNIVLGLVLAAGLGVASPLVSYASAQDAAPAAAEKATFDESLLDVPDGESSEFYLKRVEDIQKSLNAWAQNAESADIQAIMPKLNAAMKVITKKLAFADDIEAGDAMSYFRSYTLGVARDGNVDELKTLLAQESKKTDNKDRVGWLGYLVQCVSLDQAGQKGADELKAAIKSLEDLIATDDFVATRVEEFSSIISQYDEEEGKALLNRAFEAFKASDSAVRQSLAKTLEGKMRFANLVGNEMLVEGVYDNGEEIDWKAYRGKVVLVDFWATWCGPCVGEVPNVLALYEKYHEAGFDVIGYSLDSDLDALAKFEEERKLPWRTGVRKLSMEANEKDGKNYTDLTQYYGVNAIPTMILVGKDGKVLDTHARGEHLKELLEKAFPEVK